MIQVYGVKLFEDMVKKCAMRMGGDFYSSAKQKRFNKHDVAVLGPGELNRQGSFYAMTGT